MLWRDLSVNRAARDHLDRSISTLSMCCKCLFSALNVLQDQHRPATCFFLFREVLSVIMKLILAVLVMFLVVGTQAQWYRFPVEAAQGGRDMWHAYRDMREANWKNSDKYFHARGNYDAAQRGAGGRWAARVISDARENLPSRSGSGTSDSAADQEANRWGRNGGDPDRYRPRGLPKKY